MADAPEKDRWTVTVTSRQRGKGYAENYTVENGTGQVVSQGAWQDGRYVNTSMAPGNVPGQVQKVLDGMHVEASDDRQREETRVKIVDVNKDGTGEATEHASRERSTGGETTLPEDMAREVREREEAAKQANQSQSSAELTSSDAGARRRRSEVATSG